jgi:3-hydroxyisobutyrate dehydrogenase-like beta-hydroxyacid dehydrogenase
MRVGWIGPGKIGSPMVARILTSGHDVVVHAAGTVIVIHSTGDPELVAALASGAPTGVAVVDAPFSGTAQDVAEGRLTLICGCDAPVLGRVRPVLDAYASKIFRVGPVGAARNLKLLNNLLFAAQVSLASEALAAAQAMGLGRADSVAAIGASSGSSYALHKLTASVNPSQVLAAMQPYLERTSTSPRPIWPGWDARFRCSTRRHRGAWVKRVRHDVCRQDRDHHRRDRHPRYRCRMQRNDWSIISS